MPNTIHLQQYLLEQCFQGDPMAQKKIYELYVGAMYHTSIRILNQREDAEDVLQDSFVTAFRSLNTMKDLSAFGGWLKRIVINKSLNMLKKKTFDFIDTEYDLAMEENPVEETQWRKFSIQHIQEAMTKLPDGYRAVFTLYMFDGYSHKDIADTLNITESTSKSQLNRAKHKLKEILLNT